MGGSGDAPEQSDNNSPAKKIMKKIFLTAVLAISALCLCSCIQQGLPEYEDRKEADAGMVTRGKEDELTKSMNEEHSAPTLSESFIGNFIDIGAFNSAKNTAENGIRSVFSDADALEGEIARESAEAESAKAGMESVMQGGLEESRRAGNAAVDALAAEHSTTYDEFVGQTKYGQTAGNIESVINEQSSKVMSGSGTKKNAYTVSEESEKPDGSIDVFKDSANSSAPVSGGKEFGTTIAGQGQGNE